MPFVAPRLIVESQIVDGSDVTTTLAGSPAPYKAPLAPAGLYDLQTGKVETFVLHKLLSWCDDRMKFKTFGLMLPNRPLLGQRFVFRPWWTEEAWELVTDTSLSWERASYPPNGSHDHCAITYEEIGQGAKNKEGYRAGDAWITVRAYERFVRDDVYHCRDDG